MNEYVVFVENDCANTSFMKFLKFLYNSTFLDRLIDDPFFKVSFMELIVNIFVKLMNVLFD